MLLRKVVLLTDRAQYVNITCDNLVSIYRGEREARVVTSVMGKQLEEVASRIRQREELPPLAQGKGRHPLVSLSLPAASACPSLQPGCPILRADQESFSIEPGPHP